MCSGERVGEGESGREGIKVGVAERAGEGVNAGEGVGLFVGGGGDGERWRMGDRGGELGGGDG